MSLTKVLSTTHWYVPVSCTVSSLIITQNSDDLVSSNSENLPEFTHWFLSPVFIWSEQTAHEPLQKYFLLYLYAVSYLHLIRIPPPEYPVTSFEAPPSNKTPKLHLSKTFLHVTLLLIVWIIFKCISLPEIRQSVKMRRIFILSALSQICTQTQLQKDIKAPVLLHTVTVQLCIVFNCV